MTHYIYAMRPSVVVPPYDAYLKIGHAVDPWQRLVTHQIGCPFALHYAAIWRFKTRALAIKLEGELHRAFRPRWVRGEWFDAPLDAVASFISFYIDTHEAVATCTYDGTKPPTPRHPTLQEVARSVVRREIPEVAK